MKSFNGHQGENERAVKKMRTGTRTTFLPWNVVYLGRRCSRAKQRQRNVQKGVLYVQNFWLTRPIDLFCRFVWEATNINESFAFSPG